MTVTFTWEFPHWAFSQQPVNGFAEVITEIAWRLTASDGTNSQTVFGKFTLPAPEAGSTTFVPKTTLLADKAKLTAWLIAQAEASPRVNYVGYIATLTAQLAARQVSAEPLYQDPMKAADAQAAKPA